ncbi:MAG: NUDIX hydrolase [Bacteroidia bacterium]
MNNHQPAWLLLAQRIQALARTGLTYGTGPYDLERYHELDQIATQMLADLADQPVAALAEAMPIEVGYQTPKLDVRAVIVRDGQVLLVRESENDLWSLPGGYCDVGYAPGEMVAKEVREEAGLEVRPTRLLALLDKRCHPHPPQLYYTYKAFFLCEVLGGEAHTGLETLAVDWFAPDALPPLSEDRVLAGQIVQMMTLAADPAAPVPFD